MCSRSIWTLIKLQGKTFLWTWELGPDGKRNVFPQWKLDSYCLKLAQDILVHFSLHYNISFGHDFEFSEIKMMFQLLYEYTYESQYSWNTLPSHLFSLNGTESPRCVFRKLWKCPQTCFCEPSNLGLLAIEVVCFFVVCLFCFFLFFPLWKLYPQPARKTYWSFLPSL